MERVKRLSGNSILDNQVLGKAALASDVARTRFYYLVRAPSCHDGVAVHITDSEIFAAILFSRCLWRHGAGKYYPPFVSLALSRCYAQTLRLRIVQYTIYCPAYDFLMVFPLSVDDEPGCSAFYGWLQCPPPHHNCSGL